MRLPARGPTVSTRWFPHRTARLRLPASKYLRETGAAVDAAICAAATLGVVLPPMTGIGGCACRLGHEHGKRTPFAIDGSGFCLLILQFIKAIDKAIDVDGLEDHSADYYRASTAWDRPLAQLHARAHSAESAPWPRPRISTAQVIRLKGDWGAFPAGGADPPGEGLALVGIEPWRRNAILIQTRSIQTGVSPWKWIF